MSNEVDKALKALGEGAFKSNDYPEVEYIPTEFEVINHILFGCGGIPRGRAIELFGPESSGKTTFAMWMIKQIQAAGGIAGFLDLEGTYSADYAEQQGVDPEKVVIIPFDTGEDAIYKVQLSVAKNLFDILVMDSIAGLVPSVLADIENEENPGMREKLARASLLTDFSNRLQAGFRIKPPGQKSYMKADKADRFKLRNSKTCIVMINHEKQKPGVTYGDPTNTPGGKAVKFLSSVRLQVKYSGKTTKKDDLGRPLFKKAKIKAIKNKVGPPLGEVELKLQAHCPLSLMEEDVEVEYEDYEE